ncbi:MAG: Lipopolysaccharide export system ATP-binding protein LptB [Pseudomonadota bacterium]|jgi:branched-chain amino acid transport system ATP-binding protein
MSTPVLQARGLVKRFDGIVATDHVDLTLFRGARHALIGPNGAGKTTLINLLTGVLSPSAGSIRLMGRDLAHLPPHARVAQGLVRTFQINQLFASMSPLQTLALTVSQRMGLGRRWWSTLGDEVAVAEQCAHWLELFRLDGVKDRNTSELPYGQRRLLELAIALACQPQVLLLDEPMAGVPVGERTELLQTLAQLPSEVTVLLIEHDMDLVFEFAQRITVMVNGAVLVEGTPTEIASDPRVKAVYLGQGEGVT